MMRRTASAALGRVRGMSAGAWVAAFVTGLCAGLIGLAFSGTGMFRQEFLTLGGFTAVVYWAGWGSCRWHGIAPLHAKVDRIGEGMAEVRAVVCGEQDPVADVPSPGWADKATVIRNAAS